MELDVTRRTKVQVVMNEARVSTTDSNLEVARWEATGALRDLGYTVDPGGFWRGDSGGIFYLRLKLRRESARDSVGGLV